jgi:hypothetical protein
MGGGLPVGAYGGRREIMEKGVYFAPFSNRNHDADQTHRSCFSIAAIDPAINCTIERPPTFDRTHDCDRSQNSSPTSKVTEEATDGRRSII